MLNKQVLKSQVKKDRSKKNLFLIIWKKMKSVFSNSKYDSSTKELKNYHKLSIFKENNNTLSISLNQRSFSLIDWIKSIDTLNPLIKIARQQLEPTHFEKCDLESIGLSTYLYHIDRLLIKIRESFITLRYRNDQFIQYNEILNREEFLKVNQSGMQCYSIILKLINCLQHFLPKRLYSEEFIQIVHSLELSATTLDSDIRLLNQFAYQYQASTQSETSIAKTFPVKIQDSSQRFYDYTNISSNAPSSDCLYLKMKKLAKIEDIKLITQMIENYELLKKCYVVARKSAIKDSLKSLGENIENLIDYLALMKDKREIAFNYLSSIFNNLESLRFSTNRDSYCSRNLFEKTKMAMHKFRKACYLHHLGRDFLEETKLKNHSLEKKQLNK